MQLDTSILSDMWLGVASITKYQKQNTWYMEIGLRAQKLIVILSSLVSVIGRRGPL